MDKSVPLWARIILPILMLSIVVCILIPTVMTDMSEKLQKVIDITFYASIGALSLVVIILSVRYFYHKYKEKRSNRNAGE